MSKVTVTKTKAGNVINVNTNNPEYGYIRVEQNIPKINQDGWLSQETRSFLLKGPLSTLQNAGFEAGTALPGKLVRQESMEPFDDYSTPKVAGDSGVICKVDGQPIYSRVVYDATGTKEDVLVAHDNKEEIVAAMAASNVVNVAPATAEDAFETTETVVEETVESKVDNSLTEEVEVEEVIDEVEVEEELEDLDFEL